MHDVEEFHDGGAVVGDGLLSAGVDEEEVAAVGAEGGFDSFLDGEAGVYVGYYLAFALGCVGACGGSVLVGFCGEELRKYGGWEVTFFEDNDGRCLSPEGCHLDEKEML